MPAFYDAIAATTVRALRILVENLGNFNLQDQKVMISKMWGRLALMRERALSHHSAKTELM